MGGGTGFRIYSYDGTLLHSHADPIYSSGPTIADFDLDGHPEFAFGCRTGWVGCYEGDATNVWTTPGLGVGEWDNPDLIATDFNCDGAPEITVNSDDVALVVINGRTGAILPTLSISIDENEHSSSIADVDNDGCAEVVVPSGSGYPTGGATHWRAMLVFGNDGVWHSTRSIWNQMSYHYDNCDDNLDLSRRIYTPWLTYNLWRSQLDVACGYPHARIIEPLPNTFSACDDQQIIVYVTDLNGINPNSIRFSVNDTEYTITSDELTFTDDSILTFTPSFTWTDGETVHTCLDAFITISTHGMCCHCDNRYLFSFC